MLAEALGLVNSWHSSVTGCLWRSPLLQSLTCFLFIFHSLLALNPIGLYILAYPVTPSFPFFSLSSMFVQWSNIFTCPADFTCVPSPFVINETLPFPLLACWGQTFLRDTSPDSPGRWVEGLTSRLFCPGCLSVLSILSAAHSLSRPPGIRLTLRLPFPSVLCFSCYQQLQSLYCWLPWDSFFLPPYDHSLPSVNPFAALEHNCWTLLVFGTVKVHPLYWPIFMPLCAPILPCKSVLSGPSSPSHLLAA